jgi:two-component system, OmpR family, sensor kinase
MTLRSRLVVALLVVVAAVGLSAVLIANAQRRYLIEQIDNQLRAGSSGPFTAPGSAPRDALIPPVFNELLVVEIEPSGAATPRVTPDGAGPVSLDGTVLTAARPANPSRPLQRTVRAGSRRYRCVIAPQPTGNVLLIGLPLDSVDRAYRRLLLTGLIGATGVGAVLALVGFWVIRLGLRPIASMTEAAAAIASGDTTRRVTHLPPHTEAGRLGAAFNVMLDERQSAEDRLRRFLADAAHELRTPLTSVRGYVDLYRAGGLTEPDRLDDAMRRVGQEAARMRSLVDDMLLLSALDQGRPLDHEPIDVSTLIEDAASDAGAVQPVRPIQVDVEPNLIVCGDEPGLRQIVGALVSNALTHTESSVPVRISAATRGHHVEIDVADDGPGMQPEVTARVFERFFRGDPSRSRSRGGAGLGLSIVQSIVQAHGGSVRCDSGTTTGTRFVVTIPTVPDNPRRKPTEN